MDYIDKKIKDLTPQIIKIRRQLHMHPELSFEEHETSEFICKFLKGIGIEYIRVAKTGIIATLMNSNDYPTIAIRAEIDALPINDEKDCEYVSRNKGVMHACGHDGITAITLGLAAILAEFRTELKCNIKFLFEPAEEIGQGAQALIQEGALDNPKVDGIIIFHLANSSHIGMEIQENVSTAAVGALNIKIAGRSCHWAEKEKGINAINIAANVIAEIDAINKSYLSRMPFVVGIGRINGGVKNNIVPDFVEMNGTLRAFSLDEFHSVFEYVKERMKSLEEESKSKIDVSILSCTPPIHNDPEFVILGQKIGQQIFGQQCKISNKPYLAGDNAAFYFKIVKGLRIVFFAMKQNEENYPLHNSKFDFNEDIIPLAIKTLYEIMSSVDSVTT